MSGPPTLPDCKEDLHLQMPGVKRAANFTLCSSGVGLEKVILKVLPEVWTAGEGSLVCLEDCSHPCSLPTQTTATLPGLLYTLGKGPTFVQE